MYRFKSFFGEIFFFFFFNECICISNKFYADSRSVIHPSDEDDEIRQNKGRIYVGNKWCIEGTLDKNDASQKIRILFIHL